MTVETSGFDFATDEDGGFAFVAGGDVPAARCTEVGDGRLEGLALLFKDEPAAVGAGADVIEESFAAFQLLFAVVELRFAVLPSHRVCGLGLRREDLAVGQMQICDRAAGVGHGGLRVAFGDIGMADGAGFTADVALGEGSDVEEEKQAACSRHRACLPTDLHGGED